MNRVSWTNERATLVSLDDPARGQLLMKSDHPRFSTRVGSIVAGKRDTCRCDTRWNRSGGVAAHKCPPVYLDRWHPVTVSGSTLHRRFGGARKPIRVESPRYCEPQVGDITCTSTIRKSVTGLAPSRGFPGREVDCFVAPPRQHRARGWQFEKKITAIREIYCPRHVRFLSVPPTICDCERVQKEFRWLEYA